MSNPSLKDSLERWTGFPKLDRTFEPRRTREAVSEVEKQLGDVGVKEPEPYDQEELYQRIRKSWRRDHSLERVSARDLRRLPFVLFYPQANDNRTQQQGPNDWLGAQTGIVREYDGWLTNGRRAGSVREFLKQFLGVYPTDLPTFDELRRLLRKTIEDSPSLQKWRQRCLDSGLLGKGGDLSFVRKLVEATDPVDDILSQAGLEEGLARCGFLESGIRKFLPNCSTWLAQDSLNDTQLARVVTLLECEGKLRFESICVEIASALLSPFIDTPPPADTKQQLQSFFLHRFGDPRLPGKHRWIGVGEEVRHVVTRWLVKEALDGFIRLIKETALDQHWRYREKFWMAYFHQGMIEDAWFVLGSRASMLRTRLLKQHQSPAGNLRGAEPEQSVLLLQMPSVTIAEWSHNGACRFWLDGNADKPERHSHEYRGVELRRGSDFSQRHDGSEYGRWQDQVARWLRENTGASINRGEYMPDGMSGNIYRRQNVRPHRVRKVARRTNRPGPRRPAARRR